MAARAKAQRVGLHSLLRLNNQSVVLNTYAETVAFLFAQLPEFQRTGAAAYKPGLDNILRLCDAIGNPQHYFKSIHVAGTNGKGSTSHSLASIFQEAGYKTGLYTSPHLLDFRKKKA